MGKQYENDIFVGDFNNGYLFHFDFNKNTTGLKVDGQLKDKMVDNIEEMQDITFLKVLGAITDIKVGPDGYMYVLSIYMNKRTVSRIASNGAT